ncbi:hypothetical protein HAX54_029324, partial [Datura stramonium]|nr:hypothetical protein [Datura stramonium]
GVFVKVVVFFLEPFELDFEFKSGGNWLIGHGFNSMYSSNNSIRTGDYIRFMNDQCQFRHSEQVAKGLLHERGFIMQDVMNKALEFYVRLQEIEWGPMVKDPCKVNEAWVREFYANLPTMAWSRDELVAYVRGMQIILTPTSINEALGLPNPPEDALKA